MYDFASTLLITLLSVFYNPVGEMAVRQRILNSTAPFSGLPQAKLKGSYQSCPTPDEGTEEVEVEQQKETFNFNCSKVLDKLLTHGTASEQVGEGPLKNSSFVAQAECKFMT